MAGQGYGKDIRKQMSTYNTANPNATAEQKMGQRRSALTAAESAMSQPGAAPSTRVTNRLARINKPGKMPASTTPPATGTTPPTGGQPLPKAGGSGAKITPVPSPGTGAGILPGEENRLPKAGAPATGSTSVLKKKKQPRVPPMIT